MRTIYKQKLIIADVQTIKVPVCSNILYIGKQQGCLCVWYECDTDFPVEERTIYCFGTGHEMPDEKMRYIGTVFFECETVVFHFYEKLK